MSRLRLYSYWRSSSSWRVRIALHLKGLDHEIVPVHLVRDGGEQHSPAYRALNPHGLVPLLVDGALRLPQSLAILDYLEQRWPQPPLLPADPAQRALVIAACCTIACETQPLQNLRVLQALGKRFGADDEARADWARHWIGEGLSAFEQQIAPHAGCCCFGDTPGWADCLLVPQVYNAERFGADLSDCPTVQRVVAHLRTLPAFAETHPDRQPDAPDGGSR